MVDAVQNFKVFVYYLVSGAVGSLFVIFETLNELDLLPPVIKSLFGRYSDSILQALFSIETILTFFLIIFFPVALIYAIVLTARHPKDWKVTLPAGLLLLSLTLLIFEIRSSTNPEASQDSLGAIGLAVYFFLIFGIGMHWLIKRLRAGD